MSEVKSKTIIPKRATKTKFASSESILKEGEIALIYPDTGPGTGAAKLVSGDGATVAKNLPIAIDGEAIGELKNSLDIAKKIIPITLTLAGWKSVNGDNSAPYVQTVINEELKSSMNPDLVSMLDENATPNEQEVYNKNLAIISQGVGTVNNGSITYKVYKLPSADIIIGLTRLGGVKEVETASGVDDVTVGGVSVVKNKVAEIPAIPSADNFVPYAGATKDVDLGLNTINASELTTIYNPDNNETYQVGSYVSNGFGIDMVAQGELASRLELLTELDGNNSIRGLKVSLPTVTPGKETLGHMQVAIPIKSSDAANKEYVDLLIPRTLTVELPEGRVPKGSSLTLTATVEYPDQPIIGYERVPLGIVILENYGPGEAGGGFPAESMCYNYGFDRQGNIFITYVNNDTTKDKDPTSGKVAIISYTYAREGA